MGYYLNLCYSIHVMGMLIIRIDSLGRAYLDLQSEEIRVKSFFQIRSLKLVLQIFVSKGYGTKERKNLEDGYEHE